MIAMEDELMTYRLRDDPHRSLGGQSAVVDRGQAAVRSSQIFRLFALGACDLSDLEEN